MIMLLKNDELQKLIDALPYSEFKNMAIRYGQNHSINVQEDSDNGRRLGLPIQRTI